MFSRRRWYHHWMLWDLNGRFRLQGLDGNIKQIAVASYDWGCMQVSKTSQIWSGKMSPNKPAKISFYLNIKYDQALAVATPNLTVWLSHQTRCGSVIGIRVYLGFKWSHFFFTLFLPIKI
ncbi:hypothetical protein ILYODFUR_031834 [Ilyodon furcidens]|uniref:Uncharacterized protein n=1 Tax=Ilyodon furcidens TaxID=33524 RepID=A0ABV0UD50_9TELE